MSNKNTVNTHLINLSDVQKSKQLARALEIYTKSSMESKKLPVIDEIEPFTTEIIEKMRKIQ